jgi:hypothetical protein
MMEGMFGPGGPFADREIQGLMAEIRILGFINKFDFSEDQLEAIADLSIETRDIVEPLADEIREKMLDRLYDHREALLRGESPGELRRREKPEISDEMKEEFKETMEALKGSVEAFFDILTDEQRAMLKESMRPMFGGGQGQGGWQGPGRGGQQGSRGEQGGNQKPRWEGKRGEFSETNPNIPEREAGISENVPDLGTINPGENEPSELQDRPFKNRPFMQDERGSQGERGQGRGQGMGDGRMLIGMKVIEFLINPHTVDVIEEKLDYM